MNVTKQEKQLLKQNRLSVFLVFFSLVILLFLLVSGDIVSPFSEILYTTMFLLMLLSIIIYESQVKILKKTKTETILDGMHFEKISSFCKDGCKYSIIMPVYGPMKIIVTDNKSINDFKMGTTFFKQPNNTIVRTVLSTVDEGGGEKSNYR